MEKLQTSSFNRIVRWFIKKMGLKLNEFIMYDDNTWYRVHDLQKRTYAVTANPDVLKYKLPECEKGKSAEELLQKALQKVRKDEGIFCLCIQSCWK